MKINYTAKEEIVPEGYAASVDVNEYTITIVNTIAGPDTGDATNIALWAGLLTVSLAGIGGASYVVLKKRKEE